jgi:hypothetical protein
VFVSRLLGYEPAVSPLDAGEALAVAVSEALKSLGVQTEGCTTTTTYGEADILVWVFTDTFNPSLAARWDPFLAAPVDGPTPAPPKTGNGGLGHDSESGWILGVLVLLSAVGCYASRRVTTRNLFRDESREPGFALMP